MAYKLNNYLIEMKIKINLFEMKLTRIKLKILYDLILLNRTAAERWHHICLYLYILIYLPFFFKKKGGRYLFIRHNPTVACL